jgi:hypothetical protein
MRGVSFSRGSRRFVLCTPFRRWRFWPLRRKFGAGKLRELARQTLSPGMRRELVDLARRYDRRADLFDSRLR